MPIIHPFKTEIYDFDGMSLEEMLQRFFEHILDDDQLTDGYFDDVDSRRPDDNLELSQKTKYSMALDLVTVVRSLYYNSQVKVFRAFHKFIIKGNIWVTCFWSVSRRVMATSVSMVGRLILTPLNGAIIHSMALTMLDYNDLHVFL